jgi:hypothetical protein
MLEGHDQSSGWKGPIGDLIRHAVIAGAYNAAARKAAAQSGAFQALADDHHKRVAALASGIGEAGLLLVSSGLTPEPA